MDRHVVIDNTLLLKLKCIQTKSFKLFLIIYTI